MTTVTVNADKDSGVKQSAATTNFVALEIQSNAANNANEHVLLSFDLSGIPSDAVISAVTLDLNPTGTSYASHHPTGDIYVTTDFTESTVTWNTAPATSGSSLGTIDFAAAIIGGTRATLTGAALVAAVQSAVAGRLSLKMKESAEGSASDTSTATISDHTGGSNKPNLSITYNRTPSTPAAITAPVDGATVPVGVALTASTGVATDPDGDTITYYLEVNALGAGYVQVYSGTTPSTTYTPAAAGTYAFRWRARDVAGSAAYSGYNTAVTITAASAKPRMIVG